MTEKKVFPSYRLVFLSSPVSDTGISNINAACLLGESVQAEEEIRKRELSRNGARVGALGVTRDDLHEGGYSIVKFGFGKKELSVPSEKLTNLTFTSIFPWILLAAKNLKIRSQVGSRRNSGS